MFITPTQTALPREILQNYPTFAFFDFPQISNLMIPGQNGRLIFPFSPSQWGFSEAPAMRFPRPARGFTGGQPLFSTKKGSESPAFGRNAVHDLQSNFLSKTLYEFYVYIYIKI